MARTLLIAAIYKDLSAALEDMDALHILHSRGRIGDYDAAVVDKLDGRPHIAKRMDHPVVRVLPELAGAGILPRRELKQVAAELQDEEAELIVIGDATVAKALGTALTRSIRTVQRPVDGTGGDLAGELAEAFES